MELIAGDVEALHCGIADFDALLIAARVERAFDLEPGVGGGCADQLDHGKTIGERSARLHRRKQPPTTLVKPRADRLPSQPNRRLVDHAIELRPFATSRNPQHLSHSDARRPPPVAIQLLFRVSLGLKGGDIPGPFLSLRPG